MKGEPIAELLQDPKTDITIIIVGMTKDYGRRLSSGPAPEAEHYTANTIYYTAIAHLLVCYDPKITKHSYKEWLESFCQSCREEWIPKSLRDFFTNASEFCPQ